MRSSITQSISLIVLMLFPTITAAETDIESNNESWTASLMFENDLFADTDSNYTNGIKVNLISSDLTKFRSSSRFNPWVVWLASNLPFINDDDENENLQRNVGFTIGQKIFTPQNIQETTLLKRDRPYAGWLYFGTAFHTKTPSRLDSLELQLGVVGPFSLAENSQNFVHKIRDILTAKGWNNQLDNEPAFALIYEQKRRYRPDNIYSQFGYDVIGHAGAAAGTVFTYGNIGAEVRFGWNIPADFGTPLIRPGGDTNGPVDSSDPRLAHSEKFSLHGFAAVSGRLILRDIFLDGNTFSSSHEVEKKNLVGDLIVGTSAIYNNVKVSYAQVFRTREFVGQQTSHNFGSLSISLTF